MYAAVRKVVLYDLQLEQELLKPVIEEKEVRRAGLENE
jgi:hypothetical protein